MDDESTLKTRLQALGWRSRDERFWDRQKFSPHKIAFIAPPLDSVPSVAGNAIYTIIEELADGILESALVLSRWPKNGQPGESKVSDRILYDTTELKPGWIEAKTPYRLKKWLSGSGAPHSFNYARRAARICREMGIETIVVEDIPIFAPEIRRVAPANAKIYLHQHIDAPKSVSARYWKRVLRSLDGVIFVAEQTRKSTEALHGALTIPNQVIYNGVDLAIFDPRAHQEDAARLREELNIRPNDRVLLFVGRITPNKGAAELGEAFNQCKLLQTHLVIVGGLEHDHFHEPSYTERLRSAAGVSQGMIHLAGQVSQSELPSYYATADCVAVPSQGAEGLPKVISEALAMLKPCLVTNKGGALELIHDSVNGWVVAEPGGVDELAIGIRRAMERFESTRVDVRWRDMMDKKRMVAQFGDWIFPHKRLFAENVKDKAG